MTTSRGSQTSASRVEGDTCPECGGALRFQTAIEVGHIFKFGDALLGAARGDVPRRGRDGEAADRGQLRHRAGPGDGGGRRAVARRERHRLACVDRAVRRARARAPRRVGRGAGAAAETVASTLDEAGLDVLLDDRDERPGEKFADADLVGCPLRVIVGKKTLDDGAVDVRRRDGSGEGRVPASDVLKWAEDA